MGRVMCAPLYACAPLCMRFTQVRRLTTVLHEAHSQLSALEEVRGRAEALAAQISAMREEEASARQRAADAQSELVQAQAAMAERARRDAEAIAGLRTELQAAAARANSGAWPRMPHHVHVMPRSP
jgi:chromosome segregation ATPase